MRFGVLGNIGCRTTVFTAERKPLKEAQHYEQDGCHPTNRDKRWQEPDREGRGPHDKDSDEKCVLAAGNITYAAENDCAKGAHKKTRSIGGEGGEQCGSVVTGRKEQGREERSKRGIEVKVVPLKDGSK